MKKCKVCESNFEAYRPLQVVCSIPCAKAWARVKAEKEQKQKIKLLRERVKTTQSWKTEAQTSFNAFIRLRDHYLACISCDKHRTSYHAGHFVSVGASSYLRYNELNVNKQCAACNVSLRGNILNYRKGLIKKIGSKEVDALENAPRIKKWSIDELKDIKKRYASKLRELKIGMD
ncbi:Bacteriophage lambda NinG [uncultured Caudovirales phage]|uniref:Protein ninG n=1 Tax=uncultured Caudovirales phage TaxID=2100421 RepID=A0A6J5KKP9_9CAUD|nr:Bacteriophage lambda NinG [uncultured Caudovirales phage]